MHYIPINFLVILIANFGSSTTIPEELDGPLILTPYIEEGKIEEGRKAALVTDIEPYVKSYAGYFNIDKKCDSNLFFWFFPSQSDPENDPVSVWLDGGAGVPSTFGLFLGNGPYELTLDYKLKLREYSWHKNSSVIYFDNPVGAGYSFTRGSLQDCYAWNQTQVGQSMLKALEQFFQLFPELQKNPFYLTGESYAAKYITGIAYTMINSNTTIELAGIFLANPWLEPSIQLPSAKHYHQLGLIDRNTETQLEKLQAEMRDLINEEKYMEAFEMREEFYRLVQSKTGYTDISNLLEHPQALVPNVIAFLNRTDIRKALHVNKQTTSDGEVLPSLKGDVMKSMKPWFEIILNRYRILLYFGQMDLRVGYASSLTFITELKWKGYHDYITAERKMYVVDNEVAGFVQTSGNFTEILIRNAGHIIPRNQPKWAFDLYNRFIFNKPFSS